MHVNTIRLFEKYGQPYFRPGLRVLEVGPDHPSTLRRIVSDPSIQWERVDIFQHPELTYTAANEYSFPVPDDTFDIVVATNVLEHVRKIWVWIKELSRVCKPGGHVITINPVSWPYHEIPIDCWRAYPEGMKALYEEGGLEVILSKWEAIADAHVRNSVPGRSQSVVNRTEGWRTKALNRVLVGIGYPAERAYDTVTIGRKLSVGRSDVTQSSETTSDERRE
jgi:SAM-dependent methyltransferase